MARATMARASSWMAARCSGPRKDSAYSLYTSSVPEGRAANQPDSVFEHLRKLIELRHTDPVITDGEFELLLPEHPAIWAFLRSGPRSELLVAANFSADVTAAALPLDLDWADAAVVLTNLPDQDPLQPPPGLKLRPWESVVWRRTK